MNSPSEKFRNLLIHEYSIDGVCGIVADNKGTIYYVRNTNILYSLEPSSISSNYCCPVATSLLCGIVFDGKQSLYLCDSGGVVIRFDISTKDFVVLGSTEVGYEDGTLEKAQFYRPKRITIDKYGDLYLTDHHRIRKINIQQQTVETISGGLQGGCVDGPTSEARFSKPVGIIVDTDATILVADSGNRYLRTIKNGTVSTRLKFFHPSHMGFDFYGSFLVIQHRTDTLLQLDSNNNLHPCTYSDLVPGKISFIQSDKSSNLFLGGTAGLIHVQPFWKWTKQLWVGLLKEEGSYCVLARLPKELIRQIASLFISSSKSSSNFEDTRTVAMRWKIKHNATRRYKSWC